MGDATSCLIQVTLWHIKSPPPPPDGAKIQSRNPEPVDPTKLWEKLWRGGGVIEFQYLKI